jgi:periplasmic divalent cation tolerance protein
MGETVLIYTTWPDAETAARVGAEAVTERLAACANILAPMQSIYRWEGVVEQAVEVPMLLKTGVEASGRLRDFLVERHPYNLPAIVALPVLAAGSNPAFLKWIAMESGTSEGLSDESCIQPPN